VLDALGRGPTRSTPSGVVRLNESRCDGYRLVEYIYVNGIGETVPLTVAEPDERRFDRAVIAIHQTNEFGRREVFGLAGESSLDYGRRLARRGHRVFGIDLAWTGQRAAGAQWDKAAFYADHPGWSMIGRDVTEVADLCTIIQAGFSEPASFNYIGHSLGGVIGYFYSALEPGLARVFCNAAYFAVPDSGDAWSAQLYSSQLLNRSLGGFCIARHLDSVLALAASQTHVLLTYYRGDVIIERPRPSETEISRMITAAPRLRVVGMDGGHSFPDSAYEMGYRLLEMPDDRR